jgi:hypothetical protein
MAVNYALKRALGSFLLRREIRQMVRSGLPVSFHAARSIGILYDATPEKTYELIKYQVKQIRAQQKEVHALGFFNRRELPAMRFARLGMDFFTTRSLNWKLQPSGPVIHNFIACPFDILIVLNSEDHLPIRYIAAHSKARFKIGRYDIRNQIICDMMIDVDKQISAAQLLKHIFDYLNMIKND